MKKWNIRVVSTFPGRECGIGVYAKNKLTGTGKWQGETGSINVTAIDDGGNHEYDSLVDMKIDQYSTESWVRSAGDISTRAIEKSSGGTIPTMVDLHLEYGIGGADWQKDDNYNPFLDALRETPAYKQGLLAIIGTKHTVLADPSEFHRKVDEGIVSKCDATVVLSGLGKNIMDLYGVGEEIGRIEHINHGARMYDYSLEDRLDLKRSWGFNEDVFTFVTPGLISPNKGIYSCGVPGYALAAKEIAKDFPKLQTRMIIRGKCHPDFEYIRTDGKKPVIRPAFAEFSQAADKILDDSGLKLNMGNAFVDRELLDVIGKRTKDAMHGIAMEYRFLTNGEYSRTLAGGDVQSLLNQQKQQVTSGQLIESESHGCDTVAGKFWHAVEVLSNINQGDNLEDTLDLTKMPREGEIIGIDDPEARGLLVDIGKGRDTIAQVARAMYNCVADREHHEMRRANAKEYGKPLKFDKIHLEYLELAEDILKKRKVA